MNLFCRRVCIGLAILIALVPLASHGATTAPAGDATRVACVGDSITYGSGISNRAQNSYPAQLAKMLGPGWDVRNFGKSGATLLHAGDRPYVKQKEYAAALAYQPVIVVIALGTNDSKAHNWQHRGDFVADYESLIDAFRKASPQARVFVCLPVPVIAQGNYGINEPTMVNEIDPLIRQVAAEEHATIIDLHGSLDEKAELFPDRVHPNAAGARLMAEAVMHAIAPGVATQPTTMP